MKIDCPAVAGFAAAIALSSLVPPAQAQIPDVFENLQVLDKNVSRAELVSTMREFAGALGVRCNHCHVGENVRTLEDFDWASDEKPEKLAARVMMRMTQTINAEYVPEVGHAPEDRVVVECSTCHRGQERPFLIEDVLEDARNDGGMEGLQERYVELREEYYGTHTYDFGPNVLTSMAESLARSGNIDDARSLLQFDIEQNPGSARTYLMLAQVEMQGGNKAAAVAAVETAIEMDPENGWAKRLLERIQTAE